jgi:hypothetical protein
MKSDNILNIDLSPNGELQATHKLCVIAVTEERANHLMETAEFSIIEAMNPSEFLNKHNLKKIK